MSQNVENLIRVLKELDIEENKVKETRSELMLSLKHLEEKLDEISSKRSLTLRELEFANSSDQSDSEFQSLNSDYSIYPKSSDMDSDEFSQKRKERSDSTGSDVENKKVKSSGNSLNSPNTVEEVNNLDQDMVDKCIDEMANKVIKQLSGSDIKFKDQLEQLCDDPDFESLVKDVENDIKTESILRVDSIAQTSPSLFSTLYRSNSTDGNFKENISPSAKVRRTSSNRFKFDQQNVNSNKSTLSTNHSNAGLDSPSSFGSSKVLKGKKILSKLLSDKQSIDEKREKSFTQKLEITSNCFKDNMVFWETKANEENVLIKQKRSKTFDKIQIKDIVDSI